jgi:hypothetical protein
MLERRLLTYVSFIPIEEYLRYAIVLKDGQAERRTEVINTLQFLSESITNSFSGFDKY